MDIGTSGYTEYEYGPDVIKHMMDNKHLLKMSKGHLHSHNSMSEHIAIRSYKTYLIAGNPNVKTRAISSEALKKGTFRDYRKAA